MGNKIVILLVIATSWRTVLVFCGENHLQIEDKTNHDRSLIVKRQLPAPSVAYYDFLVNEFSYKVWAVFQLLTIGLLFYSTIAAIYYAKWIYLRVTPADTDTTSLLRRSRSEAHIRFMRAVNH